MQMHENNSELDKSVFLCNGNINCYQTELYEVTLGLFPLILIDI